MELKIITPLDCGCSVYLFVIIIVVVCLLCNQTVEIGCFGGIRRTVKKDIHKLPTINVDSCF